MPFSFADFEKLFESALEAGADDVSEEDEQFEVYRYNLVVVVLVFALALAAQLTLPLLSPFFSNLDLPLLVTIYFALARRAPTHRHLLPGRFAQNTLK